MKENKERYCIALFAYNYGMVNVPEILIDEKHPLAFKPFDNFDLLRCFLSRTTDMSSSTAKAYCGINAWLNSSEWKEKGEEKGKSSFVR